MLITCKVCARINGTKLQRKKTNHIIRKSDQFSSF